MSSSQKTVCPASYFAGIDGEKIHYTTDRETTNHGGVCKKCSKKFAKRHKNAIKKSQQDFEKNVQQSKEEIKNIRRHFDEEGNNADNRIEGSFTEFDYNSLCPEERDAAKEYASRALMKFALRLLERGNPKERLELTLNAMCFAARIHPRQDWTMEQFGEMLSITKQAFSLEVNHWRDLLNLSQTGSSLAKNNGMRKTFANAAKLSHKKRGNHLRVGSMIDPLFKAINDATACAHKHAERIKCMGKQRRAELMDRLTPLTKLYSTIQQQAI